VTPEGLEVIGQKLYDLTDLELSEVKCSDGALHHICRNLKHLNKLVLSGTKNQRNNMNDMIVINGVTTLAALQHLDLSYCDIGDRALSALCTVKSLKFIDVSCTNVTEKGVNEFKTNNNSIVVKATHLNESEATLDYVE
jgi:hypothetical protein